MVHIDDSAHGLLLRHFAAWAEQKGKDVDLGLLDEMLSLRSGYDDLEPTYWPPGSAEHLLLESWPAKGAVAVPDPEVLEGSLDAWFRFLRGTGRMNTRSATPKELTKEVRRSLPRMAEVAQDRASWSPSKVLMEFGREQGIELDDLPDLETLQERLDEIQDRWNALPTDERRRLMPHPDDGALHGDPLLDDDPAEDSLSGRDATLLRHDTDDVVLALVADVAGLPEPATPPDRGLVAEQFAAAPAVRQVLALSDWVGEGKELTATGVLRPAPAREVHELLGLDSWTRAQLRREYPDEYYPGVRAKGLDAWIEDLVSSPWRSAADNHALHRLWSGAVRSGAVEVEGRRAVRGDTGPEGTDARVELGLGTALGVLDLAVRSQRMAVPVIHTLLTSYLRGPGEVSMEEVADFMHRWWYSPAEWAAMAELSEDLEDRSYSALRSADVAIGELSDLGVLEERHPGSFCLTAAGQLTVGTWLHEQLRRWESHVRTENDMAEDWLDDPDFDEEAFLAAWDELDRSAANLVREACARQLGLPPPAAEVQQAADRLRTGIERGGGSFAYVRNACGWGRADQRPADDAELWLEALACTVSPREDPGTEPETESAVMSLEHADWLGMVLGLLRRGVGAEYDDVQAVRDIDDCPEVGGDPISPEDAPVIGLAVDVITPRWQDLGVLDHDRRLTTLGEWGLPRALVRAWDPAD